MWIITDPHKFPHVNCIALDLQWVSIRFEECQCGVQLLKLGTVENKDFLHNYLV